METLLVVLVIGCALAFVVQIGRGMWARTRTVVRHQDALDTLAELTQRPDGAAAAEAPSDPSAFSERQAHVRLIGPVGRAPGTQRATALPPPAVLPSSVSPFRRAAGTMPSAAQYGAADAYYAGAEVTGPAGAGPVGAGPVVTGPEGSGGQVSGPTIRSPFAPARYDGPGYAGHAYGMPDGGPQYRAPEYRAPEYRAPEYGSPRHAGPGYPPPIDHTMPGSPPPPLPAGGPYATSFVEAPTAPVPIVQPQVFYFDDLSSRGEAPEGAWKKRRLLGRRRRNRASLPNEATGEHMLPATPPTQVPFAPPPPMTASPMPAPPMTAPPMPAPPMPAAVASNGQPTTGPGPLAVVTALPTADAAMPPSARLPLAGPGQGAAGPEEGKHTTRGRHRNDGGVKHAEGKDGGPKAEGKRKSVVSVVLAAAAICVAIVAIGATVLGLPGHANTPHAAPTTDTPPTTAPVHPTTTVPKPTTTTSAPPPPKPAVLVSNQNGTATYQLRSRSASIVVSATGPCWYEVRANSPLGQIVNEGTLESGTRFSVTGPAWIRLGNPPAVAVKVDGTPMTVPGAGLGAPLNLQFTLG